MRRSIVAVLVALIAMTATAHAEEITGKVNLANKKAASEAVVYLQGDKRAEPMPKAVIDQRNKTFLPHVLAVTRGTTVDFPNNDTVYHNVFAYFEAKKFDLGMYPRGATKRVKFDKPGLVVLLCNVHSEMSAYIMVVDTPYFAVTDKQGRFHIGNVPPGKYTLHVWHESGEMLHQPITVKPQEAAWTLDLAR